MSVLGFGRITHIFYVEVDSNPEVFRFYAEWRSVLGRCLAVCVMMEAFFAAFQQHFSDFPLGVESQVVVPIHLDRLWPYTFCLRARVQNNNNNNNYYDRTNNINNNSNNKHNNNNNRRLSQACPFFSFASLVARWTSAGSPSQQLPATTACCGHVYPPLSPTGTEDVQVWGGRARCVGPLSPWSFVRSLLLCPQAVVRFSSRHLVVAVVGG